MTRIRRVLAVGVLVALTGCGGRPKPYVDASAPPLNTVVAPTDLECPPEPDGSKADNDASRAKVVNDLKFAYRACVARFRQAGTNIGGRK